MSGALCNCIIGAKLDRTHLSQTDPHILNPRIQMVVGGERSAWLWSYRLSIHHIDHWDESLTDPTVIVYSWCLVGNDMWRDRRLKCWQRQAADACGLETCVSYILMKGRVQFFEENMLLCKACMLLLWCGYACMFNEMRIWCSANPLCNGAAIPPACSLALSLSLSPFLHSEVYVKALHKTITLTSTSPPDQS